MGDEVRAADASLEGLRFAVSTSLAPRGFVAVAVNGEVDLLTAPQLDAALTAAQHQSSAVLADLREVGFLGSAGLSVLVEAARRATEHGARFAVLATAHAVIRAIEITGLDAALATFDTEDAAMGHLTS